MANLKNWQPDMTSDERAWFDACPKAVLFEMARQLASLCCDSCDDAEAAFARMREEWVALHANGIVPQKPFDVEKAAAKSQHTAHLLLLAERRLNPDLKAPE